MRRMARIAASAIVVIALIGGATLYFSESRVSLLVKAVAGDESAGERLLTDAVGTRVDVRSIETSILDGTMTLVGLAVRNPDGFGTRNALEVDEVRVEVDLATLLEDPVVIREITALGPLVTYELGPDGSNLDAIRRNAAPSSRAAGPAPRDRTARRILIENLHVRDGTIAATAAFLGGRSLEVPLPDIHLEDLSTGEGGTTGAEIVREIATRIAQDARESATPLGELAALLEDGITGGASRIVEEAKRGLETGSGSAREALERGTESTRSALRETVDSARESLKRGGESAREALGRGADSTRKALEKGTESAREALEKGSDTVTKTLKKLLGTQTE